MSNPSSPPFDAEYLARRRAQESAAGGQVRDTMSESAHNEPAADDPLDEMVSVLSLILQPGQVTELRALGVPGWRSLEVHGGFFDDLTKMARAAMELGKKAAGVYFIPNVVNPALLARAVNRVRRFGSGELTTDADIMRRMCLLIDIDPVRPSGVSATDEEHAKAIEKAFEIRDASRALGWPDPILGDSGNGSQLTYRIDLPPDDGGLVEQVLEALAFMFDTPGVVIVDQSVHNPARLWKVYGTMARKGDSLSERPHRMSRALEVPEKLEVVSQDLLRALVAAVPKEPAADRRGAAARERGFDLDDWIAKRGLQLIGPSSWKGGRKWVFQVCPWDNAHTNRSAYLVQFPGGAIAAGYHNGCLNYGWRDLRGMFSSYGVSRDNEPSSNGHRQAREERSGAGGTKIVVRTELNEVTREAENALCEHDPGIFVRGGELVHVIRDAAETIRWLKRPPNTPTIAAMSVDSLRAHLDGAARWVKLVKEKGTGQLVEANALPPIWVARSLHAQGMWLLPPLEGVVEVPVLRPDGAVVDTAGYDKDSGLIYMPSCELPPIGESRDEAVAAAKELEDIVSDFPFGEPEHRAAWIAGVLTPMARWAFYGPAPLFLFDANVAGVGKSLLVYITGVIATGRTMAVMAPTREEEMRKRITAIALAGDRLALIDNVGETLGGPALDAMLTATIWRDRILGSNKMTPDVPLYTTWYATGNNVELIGDTARRTLHIRLESLLEEPEARGDFQRKDLRGWVLDQRPRLARAALTMLRAYLAAGCPESGKLAPWGSYEEWSRIVRGAIVWAGLPDPYETRRELVTQSDLGKATLGKLLQGLMEVDPENQGITLSTMVQRLEADPNGHGALREALCELGYKPNCDLRGTGRRLAKLRGRVMSGMALDRKEAKSGEGVLWCVTWVGRPGYPPQ